MSRKRLRVAQACDVPFGAMEPLAEGRHCERCDRVVADLSVMTRREAVALYHTRGGDLCGYLVHDGAGDPLHAPERRASMLASAAAMTMLAACAADGPGESVASTTIAAVAPPALPTIPAMPPIDPEASPPPGNPPPARVKTSHPPPPAHRQPPRPQPPTAEDRALERRKRAARRPRRPRPHTAFAGMMVLEDF